VIGMGNRDECPVSHTDHKKRRDPAHSWRAGKVRVNATPPPRAPHICTAPPCPAISERTIDNLRLVPRFLAVVLPQYRLTYCILD